MVPAVTPVPVNVIVWTPLPSFPSIYQYAVAGPLAVGANWTDSCIDELGAIVSGGVVFWSWTNGSVRALNPLVVGGVDVVIVSGVAPWLPSTKFNVADHQRIQCPD